MGEVGGKCLQMDAGSRPKQAEAQRDPEDDLRHAGVVTRFADRGSKYEKNPYDRYT